MGSLRNLGLCGTKLPSGVTFAILLRNIHGYVKSTEYQGILLFYVPSILFVENARIIQDLLAAYMN